MALSNRDKLRDLLGEPIPAGGTADDTLFSDEKIDAFLEDANGNIERAAYEGWRAKAANFAGLVDVTDGNASRAMSDLLGHANDMAKLFLRTSSGPTEGRTRVGRIVRR